MLPTKNDLPLKTRKAVCDVLSACLVDAIDLGLNSKAAHWNVRGPNFIALHKLFDDVYESAGEYADMLAERIKQLGGMADGSRGKVAKESRQPEYPANITDSAKHVEALSTALAAFGKQVRAAIDKCDKLGDADTADLFTEISRCNDKWLWFVESNQ